MHSFTSHGFQFHYNSDYSGYIHITDIFGQEDAVPMAEVISRAVREVYRNPAFMGAYRDFVATAAVNEGISRLEQMETDEILDNGWLRSILVEMKGDK